MISSMILRSPNLADGEEPVVVRLYEKQRFARGGLAMAAHSVRSAGRGGDDVLLHINPQEYQFLRHVWGEPSTNPHTGLPEYGLFSKLKKALKFEAFNVKGIVKDIAKNPQRLLVGAVDPIGTKIANTVLGTKWKPVVNQLGGATEDRFRQAKAQGIDTGTARTLHGIAGTIAGFYGGSALSGLASEGLGSAASKLQGVANANTLSPVTTTGQYVGDQYINPVMTQAGQAGLTQAGQAAANAGAQSNLTGALAQAGANAAASGANTLAALPEKAVDYAKNPKNWGTIAKAVGAIGALSGAGGSAAEPTGAAPSGPTTPGLRQLPFNRARNDPNFNWYTYGEGPEQAFYTDNTIPYYNTANPDQTAPTEPWMGGVPGTGTGQQKVGGAEGGHFVRGPGSGRSDSIDAKLSDGEYVLTAEDVALLGDGSSEAGAKRLDEFRRNLRRHKGGALARGKISPNAKAPMAYLKGAR